jgi:phosphopantothenoylcysteine decarboxylase/phosphopantothenate--cysteine ligase
LVAPATASFVARTASGVADDLLGNIVLATTAPIIVAPAMHSEMWSNQATLSNVQTLRDRGISVIEPGIGRLTGSDSGIGRLPDTGVIVAAVEKAFQPKDMIGKRVLVVAGGTREPIDPVRYIGNRSSGRQGIALVEAALARGAEVTLIAANFEYYNVDVDIHPVVTTEEMSTALDSTSDFDMIVMPAAVSDFRVEGKSETKIKRQDEQTFSISLVPNPDLIAALRQRFGSKTKIVGFAAETERGEALLANARAKLLAKKLSMVVANDVSNGKAFDADDNSVVLVSATNETSFTGSKLQIANELYSLLLKDA